MLISCILQNFFAIYPKVPRMTTQGPRMTSQCPRMTPERPRMSPDHPRVIKDDPRLTQDDTRVTTLKYCISLVCSMRFHLSTRYYISEQLSECPILGSFNFLLASQPSRSGMVLPVRLKTLSMEKRGVLQQIRFNIFVIQINILLKLSDLLYFISQTLHPNRQNLASRYKNKMTDMQFQALLL